VKIQPQWVVTAGKQTNSGIDGKPVQFSVLLISFPDLVTFNDVPPSFEK
jgi:hypothetical protein